MNLRDAFEEGMELQDRLLKARATGSNQAKIIGHISKVRQMLGNLISGGNIIYLRDAFEKGIVLQTDLTQVLLIRNDPDEKNSILREIESVREGLGSTSKAIASIPLCADRAVDEDFDVDFEITSVSKGEE